MVLLLTVGSRIVIVDAPEEQRGSLTKMLNQFVLEITLLEKVQEKMPLANPNSDVVTECEVVVSLFSCILLPVPGFKKD